MSNKQIRIAVLGTRGIPEVMGGVETHCQSLYPRIVENRHNVTIFARKGYVGPTEPYSYLGIQIEPIWAPKKKSLEAISHTLYGVLRVALRRKDFDLLHIHGIGPALLVPLAKLLGLKVIMTHHGPDYDRQKWGRFAKRVLRLGEFLGCRYSDNVITVSRHIQNSIKQLYGCEGHYVPNGVPLPELLPPGEAVTRWGLTPKKYVLAVGRLVPEKGLHDLLDAFRAVNTSWKLVIAGATDHEDEYSRCLKAKAASDKRVVMTGFIKGQVLGEILSNAGLFVLPSYHEGLPIALLEAMSYDLPILVSDIPANKELAADSETFPVGNVNALAKNLECFLSLPKAGSACRSRIESDYNWDSVAVQTEKVYLELFQKQGKCINRIK